MKRKQSNHKTLRAQDRYTILRLTTKPDTFGQRYLNSSFVWLSLMLLWATMDALHAAIPSGGRPIEPNTWITHVVFTLVGLVAIWCMQRSGFPAAWDSRTSPRQRLLLPILVGITFGVCAILIDQITGATSILTAKMGNDFNVGFPGSLFVYTGGAIKLESLFRLIPIPILLWLGSSVLLKGRAQNKIFWTLAVLTSAVEPLIQGIPLMQLAGGEIGIFAFFAYAVHAYAFNFAAAVCFRSYGLLGAILVRFGNYMIWHIGFGFYLQYLTS
ncbi:hypothetical protein [Leptolyngbya sp. FACHB-16]|uniref:hypothetical protein n=1 Tax=unclassified Leptolyngbya TaxID=2650499 RepID=UPI0016830D5A|nr:hypothetical protein [Leptolyngbya sp. FACHB-16]MBD2156907.1 hypothetical protein [Leptolyngbya sp. FACHB-16]